MKTEEMLEKGPRRPQTPKGESVRKILLENEQVTVIETCYPIGGSVPMHTHRFPHVTYVIEGGTVEIRDPEGTAGIVEVHTGEALWREPQSHSTRNIGPTPIRIVEIEIKKSATGNRGR